MNAEFVRSLRLVERELDIAFLEFFDSSSETVGLLEEHVRPGSIVFMHLPADAELRERIRAGLAAGFPDAVLFDEPLEVRSF